MRKKIAAGNWKMNTDVERAKNLSNIIAAGHRPEDVQVILGVPSVFLTEVMPGVKNYDGISLAAQNCNENDAGAYTGEISAPMLKSIGVEYVILGHSERRAYYHESDELILAKCRKALEHGLKPIFCCGEPLDQRKAGTQEEYVSTQLKNSILQLSPEEMSSCIVAYEPIWAIGTGETASPQQAQDMHHMIRGMLAESFGESQANSISILYGGSVKAANAKELFANPDVDGGLVGGASLKEDDFLQIIDSF